MECETVSGELEPDDHDECSEELSRQLSVISAVGRELALLTDIHDIKDIRDKAEAIRIYAKQQKESLFTQNKAAEIKIRAERRAGELLAGMELQHGARDGKTGFQPETPLLSDLGISKPSSHRWQTIATTPEEIFDR